MPDLAERLALIIDANTSGAVSSIKRLAISEQEAADKAELLKARIADLNTRIARSSSGASAVQSVQLKKMTSQYQALTSNLAAVPSFASKAEKALSRVGLGGLVPQGALGAVGKVLPGLVAGAAAFGAFEFIKSGVDNFTKLADQIRAVQYASAASAPDASKLVAITNALGVDSQTAALGLFRLGKNIELAPQRFSNYDIAVARNRQGNVDLIATLANVATAYQQTQDPARRAAIVYEAFGRAGTGMLPILNQSAAKLREIAQEAGKQGRLFSQADLNSAKEYDITMRELRDSLQAVGLVAARDVIPVLNKLGNVATSASDFVTKHKNVGGFLSTAAKDVFGIAGPVFDLFGGGGKKKPSAAAELQAQQDQAAQAQLAQQATATLAGGYDVLAGPQNLATAKTTLADAQSALTRAVDTRRTAEAALAKLNGGGGASGLQLEAANARVVAAEANLRKAEYIGGDARVASAKASLLSAQSALNKLRGTGADKTNALATATDRLRLANQAVADQQAKVKAARQGVNDATGVSIYDFLARGRAQIKSQQALASENVKLASAGVGTAGIASLDALEKTAPGTLAKVARHLNAGIVRQINAQADSLASAQSEFAAAASQPDLFKTAGAKAGVAFAESFTQAELDTIAHRMPNGWGATLPGAKPITSKLGSTLYGSVPGVQVNVTGPVTVEAQDPAAFARKMAALKRKRAL